MTESELQTIITEELAARPIFAPANVKAYLTLVYRDLAALPAAEVRRAIQDFYCAHQINRWPQAEEIRAQIPRGIIEKTATLQSRADPNCGICDGTGFRYVFVRHADGDVDEAVRPCFCRA